MAAFASIYQHLQKIHSFLLVNACTGDIDSMLNSTPGYLLIALIKIGIQHLTGDWDTHVGQASVKLTGNVEFSVNVVREA
ncbi:hypothetical protein N7501_001852 [Penicillium viridicatum]|nr:hypothetical protein N7501_001852 [Penicillium viridicatum]